MFRSLVLTQQDGKTVSEIKSLDVSDLPAGDVRIAVEYSSLNYKDGLAVTGLGKIIRDFPMVPGIDFAGTVLESADDRYQVGDNVVLTGWGVGEVHWGGFSEQARVKADWLVPLPEGLSSLHAMMVGTAGLTAMLCVMALQDGNVTPESGEVVVTGAAGGVGSVAVALLAQLGYQVAAVTGRPETEPYLKSLGAKRILTREEMAAPPRPLEKQRWAGAVDTVGDHMLARVIAEMHYSGTVAACGLAASHKLPSTVMPFILRNVRLQGVDSVQVPYERRLVAWQKLCDLLSPEVLGDVSEVISLDQVAEYAQKIVDGQVRGRAVVKVS